MPRYLATRLGQLIPVLLLSSIAIWGLIYLLPGNPATTLLGPNATPAQIAAENHALGLDRPVFVQYAVWLSRVVRGDFGRSFISGLPVISLIEPRALASLQLAVAGLVVAVAIGVPAGVVAARRPGTVWATFVTWYTSLTLAVPTFWLGILLILLFAVTLHLLPSSSAFVPIWVDPLQALQALVMPAVTLGFFVSGIIARFVRSAMVDALRSDYVDLARAKGVGERRVVWHHAFRNALLPTITVVGLQFGAFVGGTVITEAVFTYPGLGTLILTSLQQRDYAVLQATILLVVTAFIVINLCVDILYVLIDPRVRVR